MGRLGNSSNGGIEGSRDHPPAQEGDSRTGRGSRGGAGRMIERARAGPGQSYRAHGGGEPSASPRKDSIYAIGQPGGPLELPERAKFGGNAPSGNR